MFKVTQRTTSAFGAASCPISSHRRRNIKQQQQRAKSKSGPSEAKKKQSKSEKSWEGLDRREELVDRYERPQDSRGAGRSEELVDKYDTGRSENGKK